MPHPSRLAEVFDDGPLGNTEQSQRAHRYNVIHKDDGPRKAGKWPSGPVAQIDREQAEGRCRDRRHELLQIAEPEKPPRNFVHAEDGQERDLDDKRQPKIDGEVPGKLARDQAVEPQPERGVQRERDEERIAKKEKHAPLERRNAEEALSKFRLTHDHFINPLVYSTCFLLADKINCGVSELERDSALTVNRHNAANSRIGRTMTAKLIKGAL